MFTRCLLAGVALSLALSASADDADVKKAAKSQAEESQTALLKGDYAKVADLTHPKAVEKLGGKERMVEFLTAEMKKLKEKGFEFKAVKILNPTDPVKVGKDMYINVPFTLELAVPGGRLHSKSLLVGVSSDNGKTWVFVDSAPGRENIKLLLPDLPDSILIPKSEPPTFVKD